MTEVRCTCLVPDTQVSSVLALCSLHGTMTTARATYVLRCLGFSTEVLYGGSPRRFSGSSRTIVKNPRTFVSNSLEPSPLYRAAAGTAPTTERK